MVAHTTVGADHAVERPWLGSGNPASGSEPDFVHPDC